MRIDRRIPVIVSDASENATELSFDDGVILC